MAKLVQGRTPEGGDGRRLILQYLFDFIQDFRGKLGNDIQRLQVFDNLLWLGSTKNNSTSIRISSYPS